MKELKLKEHLVICTSYLSFSKLFSCQWPIFSKTVKKKIRALRNQGFALMHLSHEKQSTYRKNLAKKKKEKRQFYHNRVQHLKIQPTISL